MPDYGPEEVGYPLLSGMGKDAPIDTNPHGGRQSASPYFFRGLPPLALAAVAALLKSGAEKYEAGAYGGPFADPIIRNWHKIEDWEHIEHALQHLIADLAGDTQDDHLTHACLRLMMALHQRESRKA